MNPKTPIITSENYEEYLILSFDGELNSAEEDVLQQFLDAHPALAETVADYESVKLPLPQVLPLFEGKEALLKDEVEAPRKVLSFRPFLWAAAALLLLWVGVRFGFPKEETRQVATGKAPVKTIAPAPEVPVQTPAPTVVSQPTKSIEKVASSKPVLHPQKNLVLPSLQEKAPVVIAATGENIALLPFHQNAPALLPTTIPTPELPEEVAILIPSVNPIPANGLALDVPAISALRDAATEKVTAFKNAHKNLKNTEATVALGNRALFTIRF